MDHDETVVEPAMNSLPIFGDDESVTVVRNSASVDASFTFTFQSKRGLYHFSFRLKFCQLMSSADNFCKQFGPRSGPLKSSGLIWVQTVDTLKVFLKEFFKKNDFEKRQQATKSMQNYPIGKELKPLGLPQITI